MNGLISGSKQFLIDYATDRAIEELLQNKPIFSFDSGTKNNLRKIYSDLFENFQAEKQIRLKIFQKIIMVKRI
jgi:hypothetical protein